MRGPSLHAAGLIEALRLNFSYVLHEPSTSPTVAALAEASVNPLRTAAQHRRGVIHHARGSHPAGVQDKTGRDESRPYPGKEPGHHEIVGLEEFANLAPEVVLSATVGMPAVLSDCIARLMVPPTLVTVDAVSAPTTEQLFFRAPARLVVPAWQAERVVAAAAVVRPGGQAYELVCSSAFCWPENAPDALRELERIIHAYVDQWRPPRALWSAPAEILLPEVNAQSPSAAGETR